MLDRSDELADLEILWNWFLLIKRVTKVCQPAKPCNHLSIKLVEQDRQLSWSGNILKHSEIDFSTLKCVKIQVRHLVDPSSYLKILKYLKTNWAVTKCMFSYFVAWLHTCTLYTFNTFNRNSKKTVLHSLAMDLLCQLYVLWLQCYLVILQTARNAP